MTTSPTPSMADAESARSLQAPSLRALVLSLLPSILMNGVFVIAIYQLVKHTMRASDVIALALSALPALLGSLFTLLRQRRIDVLGAFTLTSIVVSISLTFMTGDARLFLIRESFLTVIFGVICLISLLFPKPVWYYIIGYFATGNNQEQMLAYSSAWKFASFRAYIRNVTFLWGIIYAVEFLIRLALVYTLSISQALVISSVLFYGITILASIATFRLGQRLRQHRTQDNAQAAS